MRLLFFFSFFLFSNALMAQLEKAEELIQSAKEEQYNMGSTGEVLSYWLRALEALKNGKSTDHLEEVCLAIGQIYTDEKLYEPALKYYQILRLHLEEEQASDEEMLEIFELIGNAYSYLLQPDSAHFYYQKILQQHQQKNRIHAQINTLRDIVKTYAINEDYERALEINLQIKELLEQQNAPPEKLLIVYNNLGYNFNRLKRYDEAVEFFKKALDLNLEQDKITKTTLVTNIGIAYYNLGDFQKSINYLLDVQKERTEVNQLLATVYFKKQDIYNARNYMEIAYGKAHQEQNAELLSEVCYMGAQIHGRLYEYDEALDYFQEHLNLRDSLQFEERFRQQSLLQQQISLERTEKEVKLLLIDQEIRELSFAQLKLEADKQQLELNNLKLEDDQKEKELSLLRKEQEIKESNLQNQRLEAQRTRQELQLTQQRLLNTKKEKDLAALQQKEQLQLVEIERKEAQLAEEQREKELYKKDNEISRLELETQKSFQQFLMGGGVLLLIVSLLILGGLFYSRKKNSELSHKNEAIERQKEEIAIERNKSEELLLNILPIETANELKEKGFATPKRYDKATVVFTDFSGFTEVASQMNPEELIQELNTCFEAFDEIIGRYGLEKIKTIGDAYMCVAGIPVPNKNNAVDAVRACQEIVAFMNDRIQKKKAKGVSYWGMRIGIHTGPIVAGVIGKKKFAYDVWGDTVNVASRMETNGGIGRINISDATYQLVKDQFRCIARQPVDVHNVGIVKMYFVKDSGV